MAAPQREREPILNRMVDGPAALPTRRRVGETLAKVSRERQELIDSLMPSSVSFGMLVNEPAANRTRIEQFNSMAAGFVASSTKDEALIITNRHVYQDSKKEGLSLQIMSSKKGSDGGDRDGKVFNPEIVYVSQDHDIAIYAIKAADYPDVDLQTELPPAPMGSWKDVHAGGEIIAFGSPMSLDWTTKVGHITHDELIPLATPYGKGRSDLFIQLETNLKPGNSGGMIVSSETGEVIGMGTAMLGAEAKGRTIDVTDAATPIDFVKEELEKYLALKAKEQETKPELPSSEEFQIPNFQQ